MKKLIAILLSAVLLVTSMLSVSMFTASAEGEDLADTVVMPKYEDADGNDLYLYHTSENGVPDSVSTNTAIGLVPNTSNMPLTSLFEIGAQDKDAGNNAAIIQTAPVATGKGYLVYVEIPEFEPFEVTYTHGTTGKETTKTITTFRLGMYAITTDAKTGLACERYSQSSGVDWYYMAEDDLTWSSKSVYAYGIDLESGFKGYVYAPLSSFNKGKGGDEEDTENGIAAGDLITGIKFCWFNKEGDGATVDNYGRVVYSEIKAEAPLVVSGPMIVAGDMTDTGLSIGDKIASGDKEYYLFGQYPTSYPTSNVKATTTSGSSNGQFVEWSSNTYGTRTEIKSPSYLTDNAGISVINHRNSGTGKLWSGYYAGAFNFDDTTTCPAGGILFYFDMPAIEGKSHQLYIMLNDSDKETSGSYYSYGTNGTTAWYVLKDGASEWTAQTGWSSDKYYLDFGDAGSAFKGYVYLPMAAVNKKPTTIASISISVQTYCYVEKSDPNYTGEIILSAVTLVDSFDATTTLAYSDDRLVDLATGEKVDTDYTSADPFYGEVDTSASAYNNLLSFKHYATGWNGNIPFANNTTLYQNWSSYKSYLSVENSNVGAVKTPFYKITPTAATDIGKDLVTYTPDCSLAGTEGIMLYIDNTNGAAFNFTLVSYFDGKAKQNNYYVSARFLSANNNNGWTTLERPNSVNDNQIVFPAGEKGYVYFDYSDFGYTLTETSKLNWFYVRAAIDAGHAGLKLSLPLIVTKFSESYAGMALVNGSTVAQNMFDGEFVAPNDYNGTLTTDLVDLVQAKEEANSTDFDAFRKAYLKDYFNDAEYSVLSAAFSVAPLTYSEEDASTILSENPDRGYRTEMVLYLKEGTPDPLYKTVYYVGDQTDEQERVSGLEFETREAAQAYIDARVAEESAFKLTYYQNKEPQVDTGTIEPQYTYAIDKEVYKTKTSYYVYRAFESYEDARAFMYEQKLLRGDSGYEIYTIYADTDEVDENGNTIHNTYYRIGYDKRCVFTGDSEEEQTKAIDREIRAYFKIILNDNYEEVMQEGIDPSKLTLTYLYLTDWNGASASDLTAVEELPDSALNTVKLYFERMKTRGLKTEARFSYNVNVSRTWRYSDANVTFDNGNKVETPNGSQPYNDDWLAENCANEGTILRHIEQLAPIVAEYAECFHNISNGFIGYVGEMVYGYQYPVVDYVTVQKAIVEKLCAPNDLFFSTRLPSYKQAIANADADWEYMDYICINNDAIYGEQTNSGWNSGGYQIGNPDDLDTDGWAWMTANAYKTPQGGETFTQKALLNVDVNDVADYSKMLNGHEVLLELVHHRHTSFSYWHGYLEGTAKEYNIMKNWMNPESEYYSPVTPAILKGMGIAYDPAWFNGTEERNVYEFIRDHLGYRIAAQDVSVDYDSKVSDKLRVSVDLKNYGFAAAFNMESSLAILDANGNVVQELEVGDPATWYNLAPDYYTVERKYSAQGDVLTHNLSAEFDALTKSGTYYVAVKLSNTMDQAARFANEIEMNEQGYNILGSFFATVIAQ